MNDILPITIDKKRISKILLLILALFCLIPTILNITCLTPIYFNLENDAVYKGTAITLTLKYISDLLDLISFGAVYALVAFALVLLKRKHVVLISLSYIALLILKIPARLLMNIPLYGTIGTKAEILADMISLSFYFILELLQFLFALIISAIVAKSYLRSLDFLNTTKRKQTRKIEHILPIKKYVNWYNPLLRASIYSSIVVIVFRVLSRVVTDIGAGAPTMVGEVLIMIVNYLADIIYGVVAYLVAILVFNILYDLAKKFAYDTGTDNNNKNGKGKKADKAEKNKANDDSSALFED